MRTQQGKLALEEGLLSKETLFRRSNRILGMIFITTVESSPLCSQFLFTSYNPEMLPIYIRKKKGTNLNFSALLIIFLLFWADHN